MRGLVKEKKRKKEERSPQVSKRVTERADR